MWRVAGTLSPATTAAYVAEMIEAVASLHILNFFHRSVSVSRRCHASFLSDHLTDVDSLNGAAWHRMLSGTSSQKTFSLTLLDISSSATLVFPRAH